MFENGRHENHVSGFPPSRREVDGTTAQRGEGRTSRCVCDASGLSVVRCVVGGEGVRGRAGKREEGRMVEEDRTRRATAKKGGPLTNRRA